MCTLLNYPGIKNIYVYQCSNLSTD